MCSSVGLFVCLPVCQSLLFCETNVTYYQTFSTVLLRHQISSFNINGVTKYRRQPLKVGVKYSWVKRKLFFLNKIVTDCFGNHTRYVHSYYRSLTGSHSFRSTRATWVTSISRSLSRGAQFLVGVNTYVCSVWLGATKCGAVTRCWERQCFYGSVMPHIKGLSRPSAPKLWTACVHEYRLS